MSLKKLNMNSMKVAKPMGADAINLLSDLAKKYEDVVEFSPSNLVDSNNITNFEEEIEDEKDDILDIEFCEPYKQEIMKTETIKEIGLVDAYILECIEDGMDVTVIAEHCDITTKKVDKAIKKLVKLNYITPIVTYTINKERSLNVPQNAPSEVIDIKENKEEVETNTETENNMTPTCLLQDNITPIEIPDEHFMTIPPKVKYNNLEGLSNDEVLHNLYKKDYINSQCKQMKKSEVFNFEACDRKYSFELEEIKPKKKNNFIVTI